MMEGNTPFRIWTCASCGVCLDEADGDFPVGIVGLTICNICAADYRKDHPSLEDLIAEAEYREER